MADAPKILETDSLRLAYPKLNQAIEKANKADRDSTNALSTANEAKQTADQTRTELNQAILAGDSGPLAGQLSVGADGTVHPSAQDRLINEYNKVSSQLAQNEIYATENKRAVNYYWIPPEQPPARKDLEGWFADGFNMKPDDYINNYFEPIRLAHPEYITRTLLGKDTSGTYDIWRYELTPKDYSKTIIISSVLHGGEVMGMLSMIRFLYYLTEEYEKYPAIAYIRENVRIIYIPIVNPWGLAQQPRVRHNSNGVDINRNFEKYWDTFDPNQNIQPFEFGYKGTEPFSEKESQYVRDTIEEFPSAIAYFDLHNTGHPTSYDFFYVSPSIYKGLEFERLIEYFSKGMENPVIFNDTAPLPNACNYVYDKYRIPTAHPEWCDMRRGVELYDSIEMTGALSWYANIIIEFCRTYKKEPFMIEGYYNHSTDPIYLAVGSTYAEIPQFRIPVKIPTHGLLKVTYNVTFFNNDLTGTNYIAPTIEQTGSDVYSINTNNSEVYSSNVSSRTNLVATTSRYVYPSEGTVGEAVIKLNARTSAGQNYIARLRVNVEFTPLSKRNGYKLISATGRASEGANAFTEVWRT
jgi:Zinc carboxypeptidase